MSRCFDTSTGCPLCCRIRIRQCWIQLDGAADPWMKVPITLNLIKYATAFPPIWLAAAASLGYFHPDLPAITAIMAAINSLYSYSVSQFPCLLYSIFLCVRLLRQCFLMLTNCHLFGSFWCVCVCGLVGYMHGLGFLHFYKDRTGDSTTAHDAAFVLLYSGSDDQLGPEVFMGR